MYRLHPFTYLLRCYTLLYIVAAIKQTRNVLLAQQSPVAELNVQQLKVERLSAAKSLHHLPVMHIGILHFAAKYHKMPQTDWRNKATRHDKTN